MGAIEKVGLVPAFVTSAISYKKYLGGEFTTFDWPEIVLYIFIGLHMATVVSITLTHRLEHYILALETALETKQPED